MSSSGERTLIRCCALSCALALAALTGCGGAKSKLPTESAQPTAASRATEAPRVTIESPVDGSSVDAVGGIAIVFASGRAVPSEAVRVGAKGCGPNCEQQVNADHSGAWKVRLVIPTNSARSIVIAAHAAVDNSAAAAEVELRVRGRRVAEAPSLANSRDRLVVIGDSLAVGMKPYLGNRAISVDASIGRPLAQGMRVLAGTKLPSSRSYALAISLFTNDDPTSVGALKGAVRQTLARVGKSGCVIWATIAAPPVNGVTYARANAVLKQIASTEPHLQLVHWAEVVGRRGDLLEPDDVHPNASGYQLRARMYLEAAQRCES